MSKFPHVGTTIFSVMSKLAMEHNAINLSQGFPNFPVDEKLIASLERKIENLNKPKKPRAKRAKKEEPSEQTQEQA